MSGVSLWTRFRAAMTAFRDPEQVALPLPEPDIGLAPHLRAMPMYEHWHPGGRTLFGYLHVTRQGHHVAGFTPYVCPAYGANALAIQLQTLLGGTDRPAVEVSRWKHSARGTSYWLLARAVAQASTGPIQDNDDVSIYENADGQLFIRRASEFLDGRFEPENDRARAQAADAAHARADHPAPQGHAPVEERVEFADVQRLVKQRLWEMNHRSALVVAQAVDSIAYFEADRVLLTTVQVLLERTREPEPPVLDASLWAYDRDGYRDSLAELADALEQASPGHALSAWSRRFLERTQTEPGSHYAETRRKAGLWDALLGAQRLRLLDWSDSDPGGYRHVGLEAWTHYPGHEFTADNAQAARVLTEFAEAAARVHKERHDP